jgi:hypothetical protein
VRHGKGDRSFLFALRKRKQISTELEVGVRHHYHVFVIVMLNNIEIDNLLLEGAFVIGCTFGGVLAR